MSGVFRTIDPSPPLHPASVSPPAPKAGGGYTLARRWGGGGSIFRKTPDIGLASYSIIPLRQGPTTSQTTIEWSVNEVRKLFHGNSVYNPQRIQTRSHWISEVTRDYIRIRREKISEDFLYHYDDVAVRYTDLKIAMACGKLKLKVFKNSKPWPLMWLPRPIQCSQSQAILILLDGLFKNKGNTVHMYTKRISTKIYQTV